MSQGLIRITSRPDGEAPPHIRDKWIGLDLPLAYESNEQLAGVVSKKKVDRVGGYAVRWSDAMRILGAKHPDARDWWEKSMGGAFPVLIFGKECCEVINN